MDDVNWIWLQEIVRGVSLPLKKQLLSIYQTPGDIYRAESRALTQFGISQDCLSAFFTDAALDQAKWIAERHTQLDIRQINCHDPGFRSGDFLVIYYRGQLSQSLACAVVGTRECSAHGYHYTQAICDDLVSQGIVVNSGMALGIDGWAHRQTLARQGVTQAFLAHGLSHCYPHEHSRLFSDIIECGAAITPFPSNVRPRKHHFILRNRLLATWSDRVVMVEAPAQSGALLTASAAIQLGRPVSTIDPGSSASPVCQGNRQLLSQGATPYHLANGQRLPDPRPDHPILDLLSQSPLTMDELVSRLDLPSAQVQESLLELSRHHWISFRSDGLWHFQGW